MREAPKICTGRDSQGAGKIPGGDTGRASNHNHKERSAGFAIRITCKEASWVSNYHGDGGPRASTPH
jgi:hypothetical protein